MSATLGAALPGSANDFSSSAGPGPTFGISFLQEFGDFFAAGAQADTLYFAPKERMLTNSAGGGLLLRTHDAIVALEVVGRYMPIPRAAFLPFLCAGTGVNFFQQESKGRPSPGFTWGDTNTPETRDLGRKSSMGLSFSIGVGAEASISPRLILGVEAGWRVFEIDRSNFGTRTVTTPTLAVRLSHRLGHGPEEDQDPLRQ